MPTQESKPESLRKELQVYVAECYPQIRRQDAEDAIQTTIVNLIEDHRSVPSHMNGSIQFLLDLHIQEQRQPAFPVRTDSDRPTFLLPKLSPDQSDLDSELMVQGFLKVIRPKEAMVVLGLLSGQRQVDIAKEVGVSMMTIASIIRRVRHYWLRYTHHVKYGQNGI